MKTEFTPGPWYVYDVGDRPGIENERGTESIVVWGDECDECGVSTMANAHLISAAPELYEVLNDVPGDSAHISEWDSWRSKASMVLAKARGETK